MSRAAAVLAVAALAVPLAGWGPHPVAPAPLAAASSTVLLPDHPAQTSTRPARPVADRVAFRPVVTRVTRADVRHSYAPGCPVAPSQLRNLRIGYWGFDGQAHRGTLVVASWAVATVRRAFRAAFRDGFAIRAIHPVERYYRGSRAGVARSDARSMRADNTSAFNCRHATGSTRWSAHSWGDAVDVNPRENPHVLGGRTYPANGARFADRGVRHLGMLRSGSALTRAMRARGWTWGGTYRAPDYQHFSRSGA